MKWVACLGPDQLSPTTDQAQSPAGIQMATISGDGTTLALLHDGPIATIWDLPTLTRSSVLPLPKNDTTMTLSIDGSRLLTAGGGWRVRVWDVTSSRELAALPGHTNWINTLAIDESGQRAASSSKDGTVRCWDVSRQELCWTNPHGSWTRSVAISQRGDRIASGGNDGLVKFWKADTGEAQGGFQASNRPLVDLRFTNGTELLSTLDIDGNLSVWELDGNRLRWSLATRPLHAVRFSADGERIVCTGTSGSLAVLDTASGRSETTLLDTVVERSWNVVGFSDDDRHMVIRSADGYVSILQF
jgi:WD40 repeat protein